MCHHRRTVWDITKRFFHLTGSKKAQVKKFFENFPRFFSKISKIRDFQMTQYGDQMKLEVILRLMAEK